jgi:hypothetical protein
MSGVNYEVTKEMFQFIDARLDVKAVGIIDVEEANKDGALFYLKK